jgi:hypothetical protein
MHQTDALGGNPRYLRASLITALVVGASPAAFFVLAYLDFTSSQWDSANDSGVVQGYFFLGVSSVLAVTFALVAFPVTAFLLRRSFSSLRFLGALVGVLAALSGTAALVIGSALGDHKLAFAFGPFLLVLAGILTLPFAWLWVKLARNDA